MSLNVFELITQIRDARTYPFDVFARKQHVRMSNSTARLDPRQFFLFFFLFGFIACVPVPAMRLDIF